MSDTRIARLVHDAVEGRVSRRTLLARAAALGVSIPALSVMVASAKQEGGFRDTSNPLGVDPAAPLDVVIFKGGYSDEYAINVNDTMYKALYPDAEITYAGIQALGPQLQPRFVAGEPPDVIDNSGAENLDTTTLVSEGQLADLADLLAAQSFDTEGMTFADTLVPGTQETGVFDGVQRYLNYVLSATGVWYSASFMESKGYTYPKTWTEMLELCEEIKTGGVAPWTHTGVHPQYMLGFMFNQMLWKHNPQAIIDIDNLVDDAWRSEDVRFVLENLYQLAEKGYILSGSEGLTHTESQAEWLQGKAAFIPVGTWLEKEMEGTIPEGFDMTFAPTPSLEGDIIPFEGIFAGGGEVFIVPEDGKNQAGGKEWLRLLFSKEGSRFFAENTKSATVVAGSAEGLDLGTAFASFQAVIAAAGANTFEARYGGWYPSFNNEAKLEMGALMANESSVDDFIENVQALADDLKADESIVKYTR